MQYVIERCIKEHKSQQVRTKMYQRTQESTSQNRDVSKNTSPQNPQVRTEMYQRTQESTESTSQNRDVSKNTRVHKSEQILEQDNLKKKDKKPWKHKG